MTSVGVRKKLLKALTVLGRRAGRGNEAGLVVHPYRGYGTQQEVFVIGRVFKQPAFPGPVSKGSTLARLMKLLLRRALQWGLSDATVQGRVGHNTAQAATDRDGYFRLHLPLSPPADSAAIWHPIELEAVSPSAGRAQARGEVFIAPPSARYVVISDIDDTVVVTGVANKLKMMWRLFFEPAQSRVAYPGVAAFYRALHAGASATHQVNPILYVSRGPWSLYEVLEEFFHLHRIPVGPILFLREWGLTLQRPLPPKAEDHKQELIRKMLALYSALPVILVGDSGQRDPEIYAQVVREHPRRVAAVYIRNVTSNPKRMHSIEDLAKEIAGAGSTLMLADDTYAMAQHAHDHNFISQQGLAEVMREQRRDVAQDPVSPTAMPARSPVENVCADSAQETKEAVERGEVRQALNGAPRASAPTVVVESRQEGPGLRQAQHDDAEDTS